MSATAAAARPAIGEPLAQGSRAITVLTAGPAPTRPPIDLASHARFRIGRLEVRPGLRDVVGPAGRELVEPRVMAVLIALAEADGETVSRDELIARCWGGVVVGEDAINRVIAKLRRLAAGAGAGSFEVETVTKVGHRLVVAASDEPSPAPPAAPGSDTPRRPRLLVAAAALLLLAAVVAAVISIDRARDRPAPVAANDPTRALIDRGRVAVFDGTPEQAMQSIAFLREATALTPQSAEAWGALAFAYANYLRRVPPGEQAAIVERARSAAHRALLIQPAQPDALAGLAELQVTFGHWDRKDRLQRQALAAAPDDASLLYQRARFLLSVGRAREGVPLIERAVRLQPLGARIQAALVEQLAADGRIEEAERAAQRLGAVWPRYYASWYLRFYTFAFLGRPGEAEAMIADRRDWPDNVREAEIARVAPIARAMATRDPADAQAVIDAYDPMIGQGAGYAEIALRAAAGIGRPDDAFRYARALFLDEGTAIAPQRFSAQQNYGRVGERQTHLLFVPPFNALRGDPRYLELMADIGLVDYWRRSGVAPDLCREAALRTACRARGLAVR